MRWRVPSWKWTPKHLSNNFFKNLKIWVLTLVKGPEMRPREFLSLILILTSKTDQEFCSHQFDVNLSSLGQKMAELASFFRNGRVLLVEWRWNETAVFFAWDPNLDLKNWWGILFSSFWCKDGPCRTKNERLRAVWSFQLKLLTKTGVNLVLRWHRLENVGSKWKFCLEFLQRSTRKKNFWDATIFGKVSYFGYVLGDSA